MEWDIQSVTIRYHNLEIDPLGHSSLRIVAGNGGILYIDPWREVIDDTPGNADVVLVSHDDPDHYDPDAIRAVVDEDTVVAVYEAVDSATLDREATSIPYDGTGTVSKFEVQATPAHNRRDGEHLDQAGEPYHSVRAGIGFLIGFDSGTLWYAGDTDVLAEHREIQADVLVLPIGGHYTMDRHAAADLAAQINPEVVIPVHYGTFEAIETDVRSFAEDVESRGNIRVAQ